MSESDTDRSWHHETAKILEELNCLKRAEARHYKVLGERMTGHDERIDRLTTDLLVHKVKTGFVAGITTTGLILSAWIISIFKGGG